MSDWDVAVVGAGIAGLTAARVAAEHGLRVVAYDRLAPGGQLINIAEVAGYPGLPEKATGPDLAGALLDGAMAAGVEIAYAEVTELAPGQVITTDGPVAAGAVVLATGLTPGTVPGGEAWRGRGLSECASCDGPLFAGRAVAVLGDDEWAGREAAELAGLAERVTVLVPGRPHWSPATAARLAGVEVRPDTRVTGLTGGDTLASVTLSDGGELPVAGVFSYLGQTPRDGLLAGVAGAPGVFPAGDVRPGQPRHLLTAGADGLRAGLAAVAFHGKE